MTETEFAGRVGVSQGAVSHWELGLYKPSGRHYVDVALVLDVPVGVLKATSSDEIAAILEGLQLRAAVALRILRDMGW